MESRNLATKRHRSCFLLAFAHPCFLVVYSFFKTDKKGRTTLFYAAEIGDLETVKAIIYKLAGTGMSPQRLALINHKDKKGLTAIDIAKKAENSEIVALLESEKGRMEFFG